MASRLNRSETVKAARRRAKRSRSGATGAAPPSSPRWAAARAPHDTVQPGAQRVRLVIAVFGLIALVLVGRAARLQLVDHARYARLATAQATSRATVTAKRGAIRDRNGDELAITVDVDSVYFEATGGRRATPAEVERLAALLGRDETVIGKKLASDRRFVYLARRVDAATAKAVRAQEIPGVGTKPEPKRFYTNAQLAAHVLGFTNVEGVGRAGIERQFDVQLKGRSKAVTGLRDAYGTPILSRGAVPQAELRGSDVVLTIDRHIQYAADQALAEAVRERDAHSGVAIVMDPATGEVLALASYPRFNPNNLRDTTVSERTNRGVNAVYEPGSTLKMVTVAAALEEREIRPSTVVDCEDGLWKVGKDEIHDAQHQYGPLSITEVIQKSSNICAAKIGFRLGRERLHDWLRRFGFGAPTGIELPGELRGLIRPWSKWSSIGLANISFGQGVSATPLQLVQAAATIANGGVRVPPRLVRAVVAPDGRRRSFDPPESERVLSAVTARRVTAMLETVTNEDGTAPAAAIPGFRVAGKTGTAQKIDPVTRAYSHELHVASFVGFVPADDPQLVGLVMIDEPKGSVYGGVVAAPAWQKMMVAALSAKGLSPEDPAAWQAFRARRATLPELPPPSAPTEVLNGDEAWADDRPVAGPPERQTISALDLSLSAQAQRLLGLGAPAGDETASGHRMPNFARLTLREVLNRAADTRCDLVVDGTGLVVDQQPQPGMPLAPDARCELTLAPRR